MNNKIKKGLSFFSFFILALGVLPLGNILANEKVEPTKLVIEQNNLEANGFKIANDQVLTSEDVVKLSNVKSVDNLVDVNTLTVSDDQLANVNQANPNGGLYNLTLTNGQQANITIPVVKEGNLVTANSKGALIFKNLALSQEANNKEKVLEETGVYSVAFNNGYVNSDLTVDINKNSTVVKDTNLGLSKELRSVNSTDPSTSEDKARASELVGTTPQGLHIQDEMQNAAYNGNVQQATTLGEENYTKTVESAQRIEVTTEQELTDALNKQRGSNVRVVIMNDITLTGGTKTIYGDNTFYTIEGNTPSVTLTLPPNSGGYLFNVYANNATVSFKNLNIVGTMVDGAALNNGWTNASVNQSIINSDYQGTTFNFYDGFNVKNIRSDSNGIVGVVSSGTKDNKSYINVFGGNYSNLANNWYGEFGLTSGRYSRINMFGGRIEANYCKSIMLFNYVQNQNEQAIYGTVITNNKFGLGLDAGYRGVSEPAAFTQDALTNPKFFVTGQAQVYDNWAVDDQGNKICPANLGSLDLNTVVGSNLDDSLKYAQRSPIINPTPGGKVSAGAMIWGNTGKAFDDFFDRNMTSDYYGWSKLGGMPLAEIKYTNPALIEKYQNNGVVEGFDTDFTFTPNKDQSYVLTQRGKYRLVEREYQGRYYAVVVKDYTNLTVKSYLDTDLNNPFDTTSNVVQNNADSTIPTAVKEGFKAVEAEVVSNSDPNGIKAGTKLTPIYGTEGDQAGKIIGFQLNPNNTIAGIYDIEIKVIYHQDVPEYTVTFDKNKGSGSTEVTEEMDPQQIPVDQAVGLTPNKFARVGYTFSGWNTQADGSGTAYTDGQEVTNIAAKGETVVLYAQWTPITYKVIFKSTTALGAGTVTNTMEPQTLTYDKAENLSQNTLVNQGYHFTGWNRESSGEIETDYADEASVINLASTQGAEVELYPLWEANTYTVVFEPNPGEGSTAVTESTASKGMTYSVVTTLTKNGFKREGYTFKNWNTSPGGTGTSYGDGVRVRNLTTENNVDVHLYAQWEPITYQIKFNANTGSGSMDNQVLTFDKKANLTSNGFTKENYTFKGWSTTQDGTVEYQNGQEVKNLTSEDRKIINLYAVWEEDPNYNVVYNDNYGNKEDSDPEKAYVNKPYQIKQQEPTREGYTLLGYNTDKSASEPLYTAGQTIPAGIGQEGQTIKLYAIWQANKYQVVFDKNATSATGSMKNQEFTYDQQHALTTNSYTNAGYTFKGWATSQNGDVVYTDGQEVSNLTTQANGQVTLYAVWEANKYQVVFDANTGSGNMENQEFTYGQEQQLKANQFTKEGYTFNGWNTQANGAGQAYADLASVSNLATEGQVTLYAQWQANNYTVKFDANGGQGKMQDQQFAYDQAQKLSANVFTKENYTFAGWATSQNGEVVYTDAKEVKNLTTANNGEVTLYAVWTENDSYNVVYDNNYDSQVPSDPQKVYLGVNYTIKSETPSREGYTFVGWNTDKAATEAQYSPNQEVEGGIGQTKDQTVTLYAVWQANKYVVIFDKNAASATGSMKNQEFTYDQQQALTTNGYTNAGYTFKGWATSQNVDVVYTDGQEVSNLTTQANGQVTLYAVWEANKYQVVFDANTGSGNMENQEFTYGQEQQLKANQFTKEGYTFNGWNTQANGAGQAYADLASVSNLATEGQVTLYAQWQANNYTVKFDANGGQGKMQDQQFAYDQAQKLSANVFTKENYTFAGWATSQNGEVVYTDAKEVKNLTTANNGEVTLYAVWTENDSYNVVYDNNYDSQVPSDPQKVYLGVNYTIKSETPSREGYTFVGWNTNKSATEAQYSPNQEVEGGIGQTKDQTVTLYAIWQANKYVVIFDKNAASATGSMENQEWTYDSEFALNKNTYSNPGYIFKGWAKEPEGEVVYQDGATISDNFGNRARIAGNVTLYAKWEKQTSVVLPGPDGNLGTKDDVTVKGDPVVSNPDNGSVQLPNGGTVTPGENGKPIPVPPGTVVAPDGTITLPDKNPDAGFDKVNTVQIKPNPDGSITIPGKDHQLGTDKDVTVKPGEGSSIDSNGNIHLPNGGVVTTPEGEIQAPPGSTVLPDGTVIDKDGNILNPDGSITLPGADGEVKPPHENDNIVVKPEAGGNLTTNGNGSVVIPGQGGTIIPDNGTGKPIKLPGGSTVDKDGTITLPDKNPEAGFENDNTVQIKPGPNGSIIIPGKDHQLGTDKDVTVKPGEGSSIDSNGNIHLPNGGVVTTPEGEIQAPPGSTVLPDGTVIDKDGNILNPDGSITLPGADGEVKPPHENDNIVVKPEAGGNLTTNGNGSVVIPGQGGTIIPDNGTGKPIKLPGGSTVDKDGTITLPDKNPEAGFENDNTVQIKPGPNGSIIIPGKDHQLGTDKDVTVKPGEGSSIDSNGNIHLPNGGVVTTPEGEIQAPPGSTVLPDGTVIDKNGNILNPDGSITVPGKDDKPGTSDDVTIKPGADGSKPTTNPDGSVNIPNNGGTVDKDGTITLPGEDKKPGTNDDVVVKPENGATVNPDGSVTLPNGGTVIPDNGTGKPIILPGVSVVGPDGTITLPDKNPEAGFDKDNTVQIKPGPNGSIIIPGKDHQLGTGDDVTVKPGDGSSIDSNGNIHLPNGGVVTTPEGEIQAPPGSIVLPDGTVIDKDGNILNPDGSITHPGADGKPGTGDDIIIKPGTDGSKPTTNPDGSVNIPNGGIVNGNGTITLPGKDGETGTDDDVNIVPNGPAIVNPDGSVTLPNGGTVNIGKDCQIKVEANGVVTPEGIVINPGKNGVVDTKPYNANTRTISAENDDQVLDPAVVCATSVPSVREDNVSNNISNVKPGNGTNTGAKSIISVLLLVIIASFTTLIIRKRK